MFEEKSSRLHVPEPAIRPSGQPYFSHFSVPKAGEVPRPDPDCNPEDMRGLCRKDCH